jgi:hypothetical protein
MTKEVKLERTHDVEEAQVVEEGKDEATEKELIKKQLSEEEINVENSKRLRKVLKGVAHNDLIGYIILYNDHETKRVGVLSSIDQAVSQFVALAHGGYIDKYDQIINQVITTRTIDRMRGGSSETEAETGQNKGEATE